MHVTFGAHADGNTWPEHGGEGSASFGAPVVGPAGLASLLEAGLGLGGPPSSLLDRVVAWQAKPASVPVDRQRLAQWGQWLGVPGEPTSKVLGMRQPAQKAQTPSGTLALTHAFAYPVPCTT